MEKRAKALRRSPLTKSSLGGRANRQSAASRFRLQRRYAPRQRGKGEPSPCFQGEGHGRGEARGSAAVKNPPASGTGNAGTVIHGTGETRLGAGNSQPRGSRSRAEYRLQAGDNTTPVEGRPGSRTVQRKENRLVRVETTNPPEDRTLGLPSKLYPAAPRDPKRRFHAR